jgi:hypothetical protein
VPHGANSVPIQRCWAPGPGNGSFLIAANNPACQIHIPRMARIVQRAWGADYKRTEAKFSMPHAGLDWKALTLPHRVD